MRNLLHCKALKRGKGGHPLTWEKRDGNQTRFFVFQEKRILGLKIMLRSNQKVRRAIQSIAKRWFESYHGDSFFLFFEKLGHFVIANMDPTNLGLARPELACLSPHETRFGWACLCLGWAQARHFEFDLS